MNATNPQPLTVRAPSNASLLHLRCVTPFSPSHRSKINAKKKPQAFPPAAHAYAYPLRLRTLYLSYSLSHRRIHTFRVTPTRLREAGLATPSSSD